MSTEMNHEASRMEDQYQVNAGDYLGAGQASTAIKRKLKMLGIDSGVLRRVSVASYEVELNMVIHSLGGTLTMAVEPGRVTLISDDRGPGIPDIDLAMTEGYSTADEEARTLGFGAGMGLPNMRRNASTFDIISKVGEGTRITMTFDL